MAEETKKVKSKGNARYICHYFLHIVLVAAILTYLIPVGRFEVNYAVYDTKII